MLPSSTKIASCIWLRRVFLNIFDFMNCRITRESTPSNFIMSKDDITTRMSSNKASTNATIVHQMKIGEPIRPSLKELELFFADAEKHCVRKFIK